jgi:ABC-type transport system involved in Fe-S cluster assembly fused permease/ATPase subunit
VLIVAVFCSLRLALRRRHRITVALYLGTRRLRPSGASAIRRKMNESDTDANTKAIDSLLNFETVKYFGAEEREAARYDRSMARYERQRAHLRFARRAQCRARR